MINAYKIQLIKVFVTIKEQTKFKMKIILQIILTRTPYTGNVSDNTREDDFYQLFRLRCSAYLKQSVRLKMSMN